jgi:RNA polymerase sigma-70 factor (ECF subfamily)
MENQNQISTELLVPEIPYLRRYARALTRNAASADDLVQDAMLRAISNIHHFQAGTNLRAWVLTILHNCFIDGTRKAKRARDNNEAAEERMSGLYTPPNQTANIQLSEVEKAMSELPEEQRVTLVLVALEDLSYEEAAKITNVPVGTIRSRLSRARHGIMQKIEGLSIADLSPENGITRRTKKSVNTAPALRRPVPAPQTNMQNA